LTKLTAAQKERMASWTDEWIARGLCTEEADWVAFEDAARRCYEYAGIPWHGNVVRVSNPLVLALAAPIAAHILRGVAMDGAVGGAVDGAVGDAVRGVVYDAVGDAVRGAVGDAVDGAVYDAVGGAVRGAVGGAVDGAVGDAVHGVVGGAVGVAVGSAVRDAVDVAVGSAVGGAVSGAVYGAVGGAVSGAVGDAVDDAVADAVDVAVDDAVDDAVRSNWHKYLGGQWWLSWQAYTSFFRDVCDLELPGDLWERDRAYAQAQGSAGWWWPHRQFVMVCDRPAAVHTEQIRARGWGSYRLHNASGPAIQYRDGWALWYWHGVRVNEQIIMRPETITAEQILAEQNAEVRRVMLERMGVGAFVRDANPKVLHEDVDGAGQDRRLLQIGTPWTRSRSMTVCQVRCPSTGHEHLLPVPPTMTRCDEAIAWTFGLDVTKYRPEVEA
jgi:hypothetical protein